MKLYFRSGFWLKSSVQNAMVRPVVTIESSRTVLEAAEIMGSKEIGCLVVTSEGKACGIVTERDLIRKVLAKRSDPAQVKVSDVMSRSLITIDPSASLLEAAETMARNKVRRLVVLKGGEVVGLVTTTDLARDWVRSRIPSDLLLHAITRYHAEGY